MSNLGTLSPPKILSRAGWRWTPRGLVVTMGFPDGRTERVLMPLTTVEMIFGQEMLVDGIRPEMAVGAAAYSVGGFFKRFRNRIKKLTSGKAFGLVRRVAGRVHKVASKVARGVKNVVTHPAFRAGFAALSTAFPVLAPAAAGLEVAARVIKKVEQGTRAARAITKGVRTVKNLNLVKTATAHRNNLATMVRLAKEGDPRAQRTVGAFAALSNAAGGNARPVGRARPASGVTRAAKRRAAFMRARAARAQAAPKAQRRAARRGRRAARRAARRGRR